MAQAGEMVGVVMVLVVAYVAIVGVARAAAFVYGSFKALAQGGSDLLETTVSAPKARS
jgi:hypothetical protein